MAIVTTTTTINPLPFEHLENRRFEDLTRQLIYDYREWQSLDATGRSGSDDGFDIRGLEINDSEEIKTGTQEVKTWLIQCKREKTISPTKLVKYLDELNKGNVSDLYGLIFVASCDFSKKSIDKFREWCREHSITEYDIWGKAKLEDMLFQPKYDYLLFAYFGISLQIKKRSLKTQLYSMLATKRQVIEQLQNHSNKCSGYSAIDISIRGCPVLLRNPEAHEYPHSNKIKDFDKYPAWLVCGFTETYHSGLKFLISSHFAYIDEDGKWDYEDRVSSEEWNNNWIKNEAHELKGKAEEFHQRLAYPKNKILHLIGLIPYDDILAIDKYGDECFKSPHIYVRFNQKYSPFSGGIYAEIDKAVLDRKDKITFFPKDYS